MKGRITVKTSDRVRPTSSSVHNETRLKSTDSTKKKEAKKDNHKKPAKK